MSLVWVLVLLVLVFVVGAFFGAELYSEVLKRSLDNQGMELDDKMRVREKERKDG